MKRRLQVLMKQQGLTITALAARSRACDFTISKALNDKPISPGSWQKIAAGLGVSYEALCGQSALGSDLLDQETQELVNDYELLPSAQRELVRRLVKELAS